MKKILFLINPHSGGKLGRHLLESISDSLAGVLEKSDYNIIEVGIEINDKLPELAGIYEKMVIAGGDGTAWHIISRIASLEKIPELAIIPLGTGNDLARSLGYYRFIKKNGLIDFIGKVIEGEPVKVDTLSINDSVYFTNYFSTGIDAKISNEFNRLRKTPFGFLFFAKICNYIAYILLGMKNLLFLKESDIEITGKDISLHLKERIPAIIVSNITSYAGGCTLSDTAEINDKNFEITLIKNRRDFLKIMPSVIFKKPLNTFSNIEQFKTDEVNIKINTPAFIQIDGEDLTGELDNNLTIRYFKELEFIKV
ncbi:MAG: diacylglycerol/lipid kinase family protein [Planctomycetota bacterium]|jgi:YegS/Rv2252/BmrU family lipid kinase